MERNDLNSLREFVVCQTKDKKGSGVFCFAFDTDQQADAEKFAAKVTKDAWELWHTAACASGWSGCEGLRLWVLRQTGYGEQFEPICMYVQGERFEPDHFDSAVKKEEEK